MALLEMKSLKYVSTTKPVAEAANTSNLEVTNSISAPAVMIDKSQVQLEVCRTIRDAAKRKCNVVVTGLPDPANCSPKEDCDIMFSKFCEEHLSVKPVLAHKGSLRLGKRIDQRPRRLLVHLTSETSAASLLTASRNLRRDESTRNFYINPDLSSVESKLAFEQRQRRRAAKRSSLNADCAEFHPGNSIGTVTNPAQYNTEFPSLNAGSCPQSDLAPDSFR